MSMYNLLHGENSDSDLLLAALGWTKESVSRFRDVWVTKEGEIAVYTRCGGGNRECWEWNSLERCGECPGCWITLEVEKHPLYLRDEDDDFDSTYATIYFKAPDSIPDDYPRGESGDERWARTLELLAGGQR